MPNLTSPIYLEQYLQDNQLNDLAELILCLKDTAISISFKLKRAAIDGGLGTASKLNDYNQEVEKLDETANQMLVQELSKISSVYAILSEELTEPVYTQSFQSQYVVCFDPIDGSSNIDTDNTTGTIFSIYKHQDGQVLVAGNQQIASGYFLYGVSTELVITFGQGVDAFTWDSEEKGFVLTRTNIQIPADGQIYCINEAAFNDFDHTTQNYITNLKLTGHFKSRYAGAFIADFHRILLKGGIYIYPSTLENPAGKLRLLYEINPASFLIAQAGGLAISNQDNPLDIQPSSWTHTAPIVIGSRNLVQKYQEE